MRRSHGGLLGSKALSAKKTNRNGPLAHLFIWTEMELRPGELTKRLPMETRAKLERSHLLPQASLKIVWCALFGGGQWLDMAKLGT